MRWIKGWSAALAVCSLVSCSKSPETRLAEVRSCSAITVEANSAAECLVLRYNWKNDEALAATRQYQHEQDSSARYAADSAWRADAAQHATDIRRCAADPSGDMVRCLLISGWPEELARATDDSLWGRDASKHRQEMLTCTRRRDMQAGACLQLYYKWTPARALAVDDSLRRAKVR